MGIASHKRSLVGLVVLLVCISLCGGCSSDLKYSEIFGAGVCGAAVGGLQEIDRVSVRISGGDPAWKRVRGPTEIDTAAVGGSGVEGIDAPVGDIIRLMFDFLDAIGPSRQFQRVGGKGVKFGTGLYAQQGVLFKKLEDKMLQLEQANREFFAAGGWWR